MISQGEIWKINLDPAIGNEIGKTRPCVVVSHNKAGRLNLRIIVPITSWKTHYKDAPWMTIIEPSNLNGLSKDSSADAFQTKSVSVDRFMEKLGDITPEQLSKIHIAIAKTLSTTYSIY